MAAPTNRGRSGTDAAQVGCVMVPRFPLACELAGRPELWNHPVALVHPDANVVWSASPVAMAHGVTEAQRMSEALGCCPSLVVLEARPARYEHADDAMLTALEDVVPGVEPAGLGVAYADLAGLVRYYGSPAVLHRVLLSCVPRGLRPRLGVGPTKFVARLAASRAAPGSAWVVGGGQVTDALAPVPVGELPVDAEVIRRLRLVGVVTVGELMALPRRSLVAQFGSEGVRLCELLDGAAEPVRPRSHDEVLAEQLTFPEPLTSRETVLTAGAQLLRRLLRNPHRHGRAARQIALKLETEHDKQWMQTVTLRRPRSDHDGMWVALAPGLERARLPGPVSLLSIELRGLCVPPGQQDELFAAGSRDAALQRRERIDESLRQLRARYGRCPVGRIVPVEPWSRLPERRWALIELE